MSRGKLAAWVGTVVVHVALLAALVFSVRWKQVETPPAIAVDIVAEPSRVVLPPRSTAPPPQPAPLSPPPAPVAAPPPAKPAEPVKTATLQAADMARKAQEATNLKTEQARIEAEKLAKQTAEKREAERKANELRARELAQSQARAQKEQVEQRAALEKQLRDKEIQEKAAREASERAAAQQRAEQTAKAARDAAAAAARAKAEGDYVAKIRGKIRGNIILANEPSGNPEAMFEVNQLPTGEVLDVRLVRSSGNAAYDQAVERAILKSSPLPKPDQADLFQRRLSLRFRPVE
jgi:colicin import membrane protein